MLEINLCDSSKYRKENRASSDKLGRLPSETEDIQIIGSLSDNAKLSLPSLDACKRYKISSLTSLFTRASLGLSVVGNSDIYIDTDDNESDPWLLNHGLYYISTKYTIDSLTTNTTLNISGGTFYSSEINASKSLQISNGGFSGPLVKTPTINISSKNISYLENAQLICSVLSFGDACELYDDKGNCLRQATGGKIRLNNCIITTNNYLQSSSGVSLKQCDITAPQITINNGYILDSKINFNKMDFVGGKLSSQCSYQKSLGSSGIFTITSGETNSLFSLECPSLVVGSTGWIQGSINVATISGSVPDIRIGGTATANKITTINLYNSGQCSFIDLVGPPPRNPYVYNWGSLSVENMSGKLEYFYNSNYATGVFGYESFKVKNLYNNGDLQAQNIIISGRSYNTSLIKGTNLSSYFLDNFGSIMVENSAIFYNSTNIDTVTASNISLIESINNTNGTLKSNGAVRFYSSNNYSTKLIPNAIFHKASTLNTLSSTYSDAPSVNYGPVTESIFYSGSQNFGTLNTTKFFDGSYNAGTVSGSAKFFNDSYNNNKGSCFIDAEFRDNASNRGKAEGNILFRDYTINTQQGSCSGASFYNYSSSNGTSKNSRFYNESFNTGFGDKLIFYDQAQNIGGNITQSKFYHKSKNLGKVTEGYFYGTSVNLGTGISISFNDKSINDSLLCSYADFNGSSINSINGIVSNAIFNNTVNSGVCVVKADFIGAGAINFGTGNGGIFTFKEGSSHGQIIDGMMHGAASIREGEVKFISSHSRGEIGALVTSAIFENQSTNQGVINGVYDVKFINSTNGPSVLYTRNADVIGLQAPGYTKIQKCDFVIFMSGDALNKGIIDECRNVIFEKGASNQGYVNISDGSVQFREGASNGGSLSVSLVFFTNSQSSSKGNINAKEVSFSHSANASQILATSVNLTASENNGIIKTDNIDINGAVNKGLINAEKSIVFNNFYNLGIVSGNGGVNLINSINDNTIISFFKYAFTNPTEQAQNSSVSLSNSVNNGTIRAERVLFKNGSINNGTVIGTAIFDSSSQNPGTVIPE